MIMLTNTAAQSLTTGQAIVFDTVLVKQGCDTCHRNNSNSVKLRGKGVYEVSFTGNISANAAATAVKLGMNLTGETIPESVMNATSQTAGELVNVSKNIAVNISCCDYDRITVVNIGTTPMVVAAGSTLLIKKV